MKKILLLLMCMCAICANGQVKKKTAKQADSLREVKLQREEEIMDSLLRIEADTAYEQSMKTYNKEFFIKSYIIHAHSAIEVEKQRVEREKMLNKKYGAAIAKKLLAEKVWLGMTDKMVKDEFGTPDIKRTVTTSGVTETWTYTPSSHCVGNGCPELDYYMVFQNHKLIAVGDL